MGDGSFAPDREVTREQFVTMLHKYAKSIGFVEEGEAPAGSLTGYEDTSLVDSWAVEAMLWATQNNIVSGKPTADGTGIVPAASG